MPNKDIITAAQNLVEIYNIDIDEKLGNELIQFKKFYTVYQNSKVENISFEKWMYKLILEKSLKLVSDGRFGFDFGEFWPKIRVSAKFRFRRKSGRIFGLNRNDILKL